MIGGRPASLAGGLYLDDLDQFLDGGRRFLQCRIFLRPEIDLDDLLDSVTTELHRNANEKPIHAIFPFQKKPRRVESCVCP